MARIRYNVAMSLDGYIAGPKGEADWIVMDPAVDFAALWAQFDTLLMGRRTYEAAVARLGREAFAGKRTVVVSRTLQAVDQPGIETVSHLDRVRARDLRERSAKDIWLMGGGELFRSLLAMGEVDGVEVTIVPVLLGGGTALLPGPADRWKLALAGHHVYQSGLVTLRYLVSR
jgi:dihydrofolate reductase